MNSSERIVLGCLIDRLEYLPALQEAGLRDSDFATETHRRIFRALCSMYQQGVPSDIVAVEQNLEAPQSSDLAVLADLIYGCVVEVKHATYHAKQVVKKSRLRQLAHIGEWVTNAALERGAQPELVIDQAISRLQGAGQSQGEAGADECCELFPNDYGWGA
jgi:replicative DNA helicase